jgi:hypothetical protein
MVVTIIAWIVGLAIVGIEIALCFFGGRWLWRNQRTVRQLFRRLTLPTRVLTLIVAGVGAVLGVSDFFFPSGDAEGGQIAAVVLVWTALVTSILIGIDLGGQAAWRAVQSRFAKPSF